MATSRKTIGRLSVYRRLLLELEAEGRTQVFSHELAALAGATSSQVRRDLMEIEYTGSPIRGYNVKHLMTGLERFLDAPDAEEVALVGIGKLGRAILDYFQRRRPKLTLTVAFDNDPAKVDRVLQGCRCRRIDDLVQVVRERRIRLAILTVPAGAAQGAADQLVAGGVRGILNFAPTPLRVPVGVFVEDVDLTMSLEKVAFFSRRTSAAPVRTER